MAGQGKRENKAYVRQPLNHVQSFWWQFQYVSGELERGICKWTKWRHWWLKRISKCLLVEEYHVKTLGCSWLEIYFQVLPKYLLPTNIYYMIRNMKHLAALNLFSKWILKAQYIFVILFLSWRDRALHYCCSKCRVPVNAVAKASKENNVNKSNTGPNHNSRQESHQDYPN